MDGWMDGWMRNESNFVKEEEKEEEFVILQKGMKWMDGWMDLDRVFCGRGKKCD